MHSEPLPVAVAPRKASASAVAESAQVTGLLQRWRSGDAQAEAQLLELVYAALREMAAARMAARQGDALLQPTALVHEALLRMLDADVEYRDRVHFFALASLKMRAVLVDYARANLAAKRGGGAMMMTLSHADRDGAAPSEEYQVLALHQTLQRFAGFDARAAHAVELAYFGGMTHDEIACLLEVSVPTVERDLRIARAWLKRELSADPGRP